VSIDSSRTLLYSSSSDQTVKIFDVLEFNMITMVKLQFLPLTCLFVHSLYLALSTLAISDSHSSKIYLYDERTLNIKELIAILSKLAHLSSIFIINYSPKYDLTICCDQSCIINYW